MTSSRQEQIIALLTRRVQEVLTRSLNDPRVRGLITVTRVTVSNDLSQAAVHVSVHPAEYAELTMHGLRHARSHIQSQLARSVALRRIPKIHFKYDPSIRKMTETLAAVERAVRSNRNEGGKS